MTTYVPDLTAATVAGHPIEYTDTDDGEEVLLLVHAGVFGAWFEPLATGTALAEHRVIRLLRPGYTRDPQPREPISVTAHAAVCAGLLDQRGVAQAHIVAHSSGSVIALQLALDRPDFVQSLVLSEPPLIDALIDPIDGEFLETTVAPQIGKAIGSAMAGDTERAFDVFMGLICGPTYREVLVHALGKNGLDRAVEDSAYFFADEAGAVATSAVEDSALASLQSPVLLVQGGDSPPPVHRLVSHTAERIRGARITTIEGENHLLPLRNPAAFADVVARWVESEDAHKVPGSHL